LLILDLLFVAIIGLLVFPGVLDLIFQGIGTIGM
jgi:hypothetical protein